MEQMKTKLSKLLKSHFNRLPRRVFGPNEISQFLAERRRERVVSAVSIQQLLDILLQQKLVTKAEFKSTKYGTIT